MTLPPEAAPLLHALAPHFTRPTFARVVTLLGAAVLTPGWRTVANLPRTAAGLAPGHDSAYRRVLSEAHWSGPAVGCALAGFRIDRLVPDGPVYLVGDDTVDGHPGPKVYGKGRHRDPCAPRTPSPPGGTATSGSSRPSWSGSRSPTGRGRCRSWSTCTCRPRRARPRGGGTARPRSSCAGC